MVDRISPEKRSEIMSQIRSKDTGPEMIVRRMIYSLGYRYRLHSKKLPGRPDMVFAGRKKVIFVHGCFWHGHEDCSRGKPPKTQKSYWVPKLKANKARDKKNQDELNALGWRFLIIWQCELGDIQNLKDKIINFLD